jgi:hypothetical protein
MAIIKGNLIGELSGKLGGQVFSRNRAGAYIRQYVIPVNPNTIAQQNARSRFSSAAGGYHTLSDTQKAHWQEYANSIFSPLDEPNTGQFSGFNAWTSLNNVCLQANTINSVITLASDTGGITVAESENYQVTTTPPHYAAAGLFQLDGTNPFYCGVEIVNATLNANNFSGNVTLQFNNSFALSNNPVPTGNLNAFFDGRNFFGLSVFISEGVPQQHNYTKKKLINIANTKVIKEVSGPGTTGLTSLTLSWQSSIQRENYSALAFATEYVNLYVVETTSQGQRKGLASKKIQLS